MSKEPENLDTELNDGHFKLLVNSIKDYAIFILSPQGYIRSWNAGAERFKGYKSHEIIGKHFSIFYTQFDIERNHPQKELEIATEKGIFEEEGWRLRKDGSVFWANIVITKLVDSTGKHIGFAKVTRDLTERRKLEEELRKSNEDLDQKVKERTMQLEKAIQSREEFISIVSHELRTPVTALKLQTQTALRQLAKDSPEVFYKKTETFFKRTDQQLERISVLLNDILDVSQISMERLTILKERLDINDTLQDVIDRFEEVAKNTGVTIEFSKSSPLYVQGDKIRLEQVFSNLISNALKYGDMKPIKISTESSDNKAIISISDQGIGIAKEDQARIFERFERATSRNLISGIGVGLFISKKIIEAHNGEVLVKSEPGKGSTFTVVLHQSE